MVEAMKQKKQMMMMMMMIDYRHDVTIERH